MVERIIRRVEMVIWKYELEVGSQRIEMPVGARLLDIQCQRGKPCLWVLCDPSATMCRRRFEMYGTGHDTRREVGEYVGTFQMDCGYVVFHVFDEGYVI